MAHGHIPRGMFEVWGPVADLLAAQSGPTGKCGQATPLGLEAAQRLAFAALGLAIATITLAMVTIKAGGTACLIRPARGCSLSVRSPRSGCTK